MKILLFSICLLLPCLLSAGEIYKWVDENGRVHFSDKPVNDTAQEIEIKEEDNQRNTLTTDEQRKQKRDKLLKAYEEERRIKKEKEVREKQQKEKLKYRCARERDSLKRMKRGGSFYDMDKDGNRVFLDETEIKKRITEMESNVDKYCN
ncbi:MAG: DUF4124 domain-containing protein [Gammaproteobacteria bacterium]|nr:DUF4124 domain-containing protein [Gammaproteobacteria bacterium]MDH5594790.1 DUF4124 domain-containing protein [Gammaproteobacteria bacterium]MDH5614695.1 DUF4124 domain-containing protein [Gammaproteobacteria bacterium]